MSLSQHLMPSNSVAAKSTAHSAFLRFLKDEEMTLEEVYRSITSTRDGSEIAVVMDKFAIHLASSPSRKGERLAKNTVDSYFGQVKSWILACYPELRAIAQPAVDAVGARLKKYCTKRSGGSIVQKAPACRKSDLRNLLGTVYQYGSSASVYLDGLLLVWLWHLFGRSSDLNSVSTRNLSIYPGGALLSSCATKNCGRDWPLALSRSRLCDMSNQCVGSGDDYEDLGRLGDFHTNPSIRRGQERRHGAFERASPRPSQCSGQQQ